MGLVSEKTVNAVEAVLDVESWMPVRTITARANCGAISTVRSALAQLREEGRVVRGGRPNDPTYRRATESEREAAA